MGVQDSITFVTDSCDWSCFPNRVIMKEKSAKLRKNRTRVESPLSANLRSVMEEHHLSVRKAAALCGVTASVFHSWLKGSYPADATKLLNLAKETNTDFQFLLTGVSSGKDFQNTDLRDLFNIESEPTLEGVFLITAKRLKRKV